MATVSGPALTLDAIEASEGDDFVSGAPNTPLVRLLAHEGGKRVIGTVRFADFLRVVKMFQAEYTLSFEECAATVAILILQEMVVPKESAQTRGRV